MPNPTACLLIIGNEVLSGRTRDANLQFLATRLGEIGIPMKEVRVIPDVPEVIINTVNESAPNSTMSSPPAALARPMMTSPVNASRAPLACHGNRSRKPGMRWNPITRARTRPVISTPPGNAWQPCRAAQF